MRRGRFEVDPAAALAESGEVRQPSLVEEPLDPGDADRIELEDAERAMTLRTRARA
jgi:hypothetical protein